MENLTIVSVSSAAEANRYVLEGLQNRRVGVTNMNSRSSRSHAIFTLYMTCEVPSPSPLHRRRYRSPSPSHANRNSISSTSPAASAKHSPAPMATPSRRPATSTPPSPRWAMSFAPSPTKKPTSPTETPNSPSCYALHLLPAVISRTPWEETPSPRLSPPSRRPSPRRPKRCPRFASPPTRR